VRPLPITPLSPCKERKITVSRFSTMSVGNTGSSVLSRSIGASLLVWLHSEVLEGSVGTIRVCDILRLIGKQPPLHRFPSDHLVAGAHAWSVCAASRSRDEFFPTTTFRLAAGDR
jgi:hypothetical protein